MGWCVTSKGEVQVQGDFLFHILCFSRCQGPSRCPGKVFPQVTIHGRSNNVQVTGMCSSPKPSSSLEASGTHLDAQLLEATMRRTAPVNRGVGMRELASLPRVWGTDRGPWKECLTEHRRPLEVALYGPSVWDLSDLLPSPSGVLISPFHLRTFNLDWGEKCFYLLSSSTLISVLCAGETTHFLGLEMDSFLCFLAVSSLLEEMTTDYLWRVKRAKRGKGMQRT